MLGTGPLFFWIGLLATLATARLLPASLTYREPSTVIDFTRNGVGTRSAGFRFWRAGETERIAGIDADVLADRWHMLGIVAVKDRRARERAASIVSQLTRK